MIWKASTLSNLGYNKAFSKMLRISGFQLKKDSPGDNGKPTQQTCKSGRILISNHGRSACNPRKSQPEKDRTFSAGATPHQVFFRSRKHITCKEISQAKPLIQPGARFGSLLSGPKFRSFFGSRPKTASSPGTTS
jgi:hypothetical protein